MQDLNNDMQVAAMQSYVKTVHNSPNVVCECGSKVFHEAVVLKKISALLSPSGKEELVPIPVYVCDKCGKIPEEFTSKAAAKKILGEEEVKEENTILTK